MEFLSIEKKMKLASNLALILGVTGQDFYELDIIRTIEMLVTTIRLMASLTYW